MQLKGRHLLNSTDFSVEELYSMIELADKIAKKPEDYSEKCKGKIMAALFYEPSTRTRLSFEAAMKRLGGDVIGFPEMSTSSESKGESIADTVRIVACYSDIVVMRHHVPFVPHKISEYITVPFINAGDGSNQHPTQTLADIFTIYKYKKKLSNLKIGFCGDLKYGRTVHSLIKTMDRYENNIFECISPDCLKIPDDLRNEIKSPLRERECLEDVLGELDILYMTRIQKERFEDLDEYNRIKGYYILTKEKMENAKKDAMILHPLPRVDEIHESVDDDPRAFYFKQARAGMYMRMSLILHLLGLD